MASSAFFSLQPSQQREGLSAFRQQGANLPHVGSQASYLDPSLNGGETLHSPFEDEATQAAQGMAGSSLMRPSGDSGPGSVGITDQGFQSNVTGTQFRIPNQTTRTQLPQSAPQGAQLSADQIQTLQTLGAVQKGLGAIPDSLFNAVKDSIKNTPEGQRLSDTQVNDFINNLSNDVLQTTGSLEGNDIYEALTGSPYQGYSLGDTKLNSDFLNDYTTGAKTSTQPSATDKFALGDVQGALGVAQASVTGDPVQILRSLNSVAPNVAKYITDNKDVISGVGNTATALGGAYSLYQGIQSGNPTQIAQGISAVMNGAGHLVGMDVISQMTGVSTEALGKAFGVAGGVVGALSLIDAIDRGDPLQAAMSAASVYGALSTVAPNVFTPLADLAVQAATQIASQVAGQAAGVALNATLQTVSAVAGSVLAAAAPVIMAVLSWISEDDKRSAMNSWANLGKPLTIMQERALSAGQQAGAMYQQVKQAGITDPTVLKKVLAAGAGALNTFYDNEMVMGRRFGPLAYYDRTKQDPTEFKNLLQQNKEGLFGVLQELANQGVPLSELNNIPADVGFGDITRPGYAGEYVDIPKSLAYYKQDIQGGLPMTGQTPGQAMYGTGYLRQPEFNAATGSPFMSLIASLNPEMYTNLGGTVDWNSPVVQAALERDRQAAAMADAAAYQDFTSGGGGF